MFIRAHVRYLISNDNTHAKLIRLLFRGFILTVFANVNVPHREY